MDQPGRKPVHRASCMAALVYFAWPIATAEPTADPADQPDQEFLEFLGETSGMDPELVPFMESSEAKRAARDAARKSPVKDDPHHPAGTPVSLESDSAQIMGDGAARWHSMSETDRAAARARFNTWKQLAPADRAQARERWKQFRALTPVQQEAVREAYRKSLEPPPERRDMLTNRWDEMSPEERRRAIQRRQGPKPGSVDKRPCPPC